MMIFKFILTPAVNSEFDSNKNLIANSEFGKAFLAGSISGTISAVLFQPLDVIKTLKQRSPSHRIGYVELLKNFTDKEHALGFWRGLTPSLLRAVPGVGLYFATLNYLKNNVISNEPNSFQAVVAGAAARTVSCVCLIPITVIKTRFESGEYTYNGISHAVGVIYKEEGIRGFTRGLLPTILRDAPYSGVYLMFYMQLKRLSQFVIEDSDRKSLESCRIFSCGIVAGCLASVITHPPDVVKTKMQLYPNKFNNFSSGIFFIYKKYGLKGFTKGLSPRLIRRTLVTAMSWTVYERIAVCMNLK